MSSQHTVILRFFTVLVATAVAVLAFVCPVHAQEGASEKSLEHLFLKAMNDIADDKFSDSSKKFSELQTAAARAGWESLPTFSIALAERAEVLLAAGEREKAAFLLRRAEELSPRHPRVLVALSRYPEIFGAGGAAGLVLKAFRYSISSPVTAGVLLVNVLLLGLVSLTVAFAVVCVVQCVRSIDALFERVTKSLPQYCRGALGAPLVYVLLVLPAFAGILFAIGCWSFLLSRSVGSCKRLALAAGVIIVCWGLALPVSGALLSSVSSKTASVVGDIHAMAYPQDLRQLDSARQSWPQTPLLDYSAAQAAYFEGRLEQAKTDFKKISIKNDAALGRTVRANIAAVDLALQRVNEAKTEFIALEAEFGPSFETTYNMALVSLAELDTASQRRFYEQARAIDPDRLSRLELLTSGAAVPLLTSAPKRLFLPFLMRTFDIQPASERSSARSRESAVASALVFSAGPMSLVALGICVLLLGVFGTAKQREVETVAPVGLLWKVVPGGRSLCGAYPVTGACLLALFIGLILAGSGVPVHLVPIVPLARDSSALFFYAAAGLLVVSQAVELFAANARAAQGAEG